jgi:hypothetical protein
MSQPLQDQGKVIDLKHLFTYHPPKEGQAERYEQIRVAALNFGKVVCKLSPSSREQTHALNKIREAVMWANAAIALNE